MDTHRPRNTKISRREVMSLMSEVRELREELRAKEKEFQSLKHVAVLMKAFGYAFGVTLGLFVLLSNSISGALKTIWRDVGNNWSYGYGWLEKHFGPAEMFIGVSTLLHMFVFWTLCLALAYIDVKGTNSYFRRYKIQPFRNVPLPWERQLDAFKVALRNQIFVTLPLAFLAYPLFVWRGCSMTLPLPDWYTFLGDLVIFVLVEEILFYYAHRLFHHPLFYGPFHKFHHEFTAPVGAASIYAHPLEHALANLLPIFAGPFLCGTHLATFWAWQVLATVTTINSHSGYHLPFLSSPEHHDYHHARRDCNYGVLGLLDYLHDTDALFRSSAQYENHHTFFSFDYEYKPVIPLAHLNNSEASVKLRKEKERDDFLCDPLYEEELADKGEVEGKGVLSSIPLVPTETTN